MSSTIAGSIKRTRPAGLARWRAEAASRIIGQFGAIPVRVVIDGEGAWPPLR
jgi:hypothetical protein